MSAIWKIQGRAVGGIAPDQQADITRVAARAVRNYTAGKLQDAERDCQTILARDPNHIQSLLLLKGVAQQLGRPDAVVDLLARIAKTFLTYGRLEAAAAYFTEIVMLRPDLAEPYHFLGIAHGQHGKAGEAGSWLELLLTLRPDDGPALAERART